MDGSGRSESSRDRQPWTLEMMLENKEKWNLAADVGVLDYLQKFGNDLLNETENTLQLLDTFESELNTSCVQVSNITNKFLSLADSQFVENRVYEDEETATPETDPTVVAKTKQEEERLATERLKEAIGNGLNVLRTKFEVVEVVNSDSDEDDSGPSGFVYKPINPFNSRPLPHLIGSVEFMKDPTVGLEEPPSDDDEESLNESLSSESKALSEENDESDLDSDRPNTLPVSGESHTDNLADVLYKQPISSSFADHLAKRLEDMDTDRKIKHQPQKPTRNIFSTTPPPLDDSCDDEFGSSEDLIFGNRNSRKPFDDDLFVPKSKSSLWDDNQSDDFSNTRNISNPSSDINERRKHTMSDFEKELSRNLQKRNVHHDDMYDDILSPSPPPLDKQIGDSYDDIQYDEDNFVKRNNQRSSLFNDDDYDNVPSKSYTSDETKRLPSTGSKIESNHDRLYNHVSDIDRKDSSESEVVSKSISNLRRRNYGDDDTDDDSVVNNENFEDVNSSVFKTIDQQEKSKSSSRSSSVKMSESFQDDNVSIKSNRSAGLFDDVVTNTTKKNAIKKNMDDLFSDMRAQNDASDDDEDLFNTYAKPREENTKNNSSKTSRTMSVNASSSKSNKVIDDLFGDFDNNDLFSKLNVSKTVEPKSKISNATRDSNVNEVNKETSSSKRLVSTLFDDDNDDDIGVFSSVKSSNPRIKSNESKQPSNSNIQASSSSKKKTSGGLFDDTDDSDLFSSDRTKHDLFSSDLFSSNSSTFSKNNDTQNLVGTNEGRKPVASIFSSDETDNLFSDVTTTVKSKSYGDNTVKGNDGNYTQKDDQTRQSVTQENLKQDFTSTSVVNTANIKTANVKQIPLFTDEDASDLLFTSPVARKNAADSVDTVDDSPLFHESANKTKLSNGSEVSSSTKVIDTNESLDKNLKNKTDSKVENDLFKHMNEYDEKSKEDHSSLLSNAVKNNISELGDGLMFDNTKAFVSTSSNSQSNDVDERNVKEDKESPSSLFDVDNSLPNIPEPSSKLKKPDVPVRPKPNKPDPPKTLNIRSPISTPDPFGLNTGDNKVASIIQSLDVPDGGVFSSEKSQGSSDKSSASPRVPGKLNLEKTLHIDPKALLPGARPVSFKKSSSPSESKDSIIPTSPQSSVDKHLLPTLKPVESKDISSTETSVPNSEPVLHSIAKDRVKIQVKRRPQTRKARREAVRQSMIDNTDGDETDNSSSITTTHSGKEKSTASSLFDPPSNILSPSTDEEDLFGVPPLDLPADYTKVSMSPGDIFDTPNPTIISPDLSVSDTRKTNDSSKISTDFDDKTRNPKIESSDDLFESNKLGNDAVSKGVVPRTTVKDLFDNNEPLGNSRDLFDKFVSDNSEDIFANVGISKVVEGSSDNLFRSRNSNERTEIISEVSNETPQSLISDTSMDGSDYFLAETSVEDRKTSEDDLFTNKKIPVIQRKESSSSSTLVNELQSELSSSQIPKTIDKIDIFADLDDSELFASTSASKTDEFRPKDTEEPVKQDPPINICSVLNTGVVNICDKLSITPPNDDELFLPSDWSISSNNRKEESRTITSAPEKIKTDPLFDDDQLFKKPSPYVKQNQSNISVSTGHPKDKSKEKESITKTKVDDNLFATDDDDDVSLFGSANTTSWEPMSASSNKTKLFEEKRNKISSLFEGDDADDFFTSANKNKTSFKSNNIIKSSENIFESSASASQSTSKKPIGTIKKFSGASSSKTSEIKTDGKDDFVDPLSAFADND